MLACTVLLEGSSKWEALKKGGTFVLPKAQFTLTNKLQRQQFRSPTLHEWQTTCYLHRKVQEGEVIQPKQFGFKQMPLVRHHKTPSKNRTKKRVRKHRFYPFSIYKKAPLGHPLSLHDAQGSCALESTTVAPNASKETSRRPSGISAPPSQLVLAEIPRSAPTAPAPLPLRLAEPEPSVLLPLPISAKRQAERSAPSSCCRQGASLPAGDGASHAPAWSSRYRL